MNSLDEEFELQISSENFPIEPALLINIYWGIWGEREREREEEIGRLSPFYKAHYRH